MGLVDLHTHSSVSDGQYPPAELVRLALEEGLDVLALTDHDTLEGLPEFTAAAAGTSLTAVPGVEISTKNDGPGSVHLLVYGADPTSPVLQDLLRAMAESRRARAPRMVEQLRAHGLELTLAEVLEVAGREEVSRSHFAILLVRRGLARDQDDAFDRYLKFGRPGYYERLKKLPEECIRVGLEAGGVPVLAHPWYVEKERPEALEPLLERLVRAGLRGLEVHYPDHTPEQTARYLALARRHGLLVTGGSDFHGGEVKPGVRLGRGAGGGFEIPRELAEGLLEEMARARRG